MAAQNHNRSRWNPFGRLAAAGSPLVDPRRTVSGRELPPPSPAVIYQGPAGPDAIRARTQEWQKRSLMYRDAIPEVAGGAALIRASLESIEWVVEGTGYAGGKQRAQERINDTDIPRLGELIWVSGESWLAVPVDPEGWDTPSYLIAPYSLSVAEINIPTEPPTMKGPNNEAIEMEDPLMRIWRPSAENRWQASSALKSCMDLLESMYLSQRVDSATQRSRLVHAGIMFWPTNAPDVPVAEGEEPTPGSRQAMLAEFRKATEQTVDMNNRGQEPATPFVVTYDPGTAEIHYKPEMFRVERDDLASQYVERNQEYGRRLSIALELPMESVTGTSGANRFSIHQIDVDKSKTWVSPLCETIRVQLERELVKMYGPGLTLKADPKKLIAKPDQTDVIVKLAQLQIVTPDSVKKALVEGDLALLEPQEPPQTSYTSNAAPGQPSDFGAGNTDRGGGKYRQNP